MKMKEEPDENRNTKMKNNENAKIKADKAVQKLADTELNHIVGGAGNDKVHIIKEKANHAKNEMNTEPDRAAIQTEINASQQQID